MQKSSADSLGKRRIFPPILSLYEEIQNLTADHTLHRFTERHVDPPIHKNDRKTKP